MQSMCGFDIKLPQSLFCDFDLLTSSEYANECSMWLNICMWLIQVEIAVG